MPGGLYVRCEQAAALRLLTVIEGFGAVLPLAQ